MIRYAQQQRSISRRAGVIVTVVLVHAVMVYGLVTGSAHRVIEVVRQPLMTKVIEEVKPPEQAVPPPPLTPKLAPPPPPFVPMPEIQIRRAPAVTNAITQVTTTKPAEPPPPSPVVEKQQSVRTPPVVRASACDKPEYPPVSRRLQETGTVVLSFLIDTDGKVIQSKVMQSSGHARLDEAARQALSLCAFSPGTVDGKPEQAWAQIQYSWKLE